MTDNLEAYKQYLAVDKLSRTVRDAITVTRALGFRYLWSMRSTSSRTQAQKRTHNSHSWAPSIKIQQSRSLPQSETTQMPASSRFVIRTPGAHVYSLKKAYPTVSPARCTRSSTATIYMIRPSICVPGSSKRNSSHGGRSNSHPRASAGPAHSSAWLRRCRASAYIYGRTRTITFLNGGASWTRSCTRRRRWIPGEGTLMIGTRLWRTLPGGESSFRTTGCRRWQGWRRRWES